MTVRSRVSVTSASTALAPAATPARKPTIVFSGLSPRAPRWPTTSKARASARRVANTIPAMAKVFEEITDHIREWVSRQPMFFVATAPLQPDGHVNVSPKGPIGSLRITGPHSLAFLDISGSGAETIAHVRENGRIVIMLCAFEGPPRIVRFHGTGTVLRWDEPGFDAAAAGFEHADDPRGAALVVTVDVDPRVGLLRLRRPADELRGDARAPRPGVGQEAARDGPRGLRGAQADQERGLARRPARRGLTRVFEPTLPNLLTVFRILLVPVLVVVLLSEVFDTYWPAAVVFVIASATDVADGYLARRNDQVTNFGKLWDPLADKLLVTAALISLVDLGKLEAWVAMVIIAREFAVTGLRQVAVEQGHVIAASVAGKVKTFLQVAMVLVLIIVDEHTVLVDLLVYARSPSRSARGPATSTACSALRTNRQARS